MTHFLKTPDLHLMKLIFRLLISLVCVVLSESRGGQVRSQDPDKSSLSGNPCSATSSLCDFGHSVQSSEP